MTARAANFSKAYLKDKKVECWGVDDDWHVYIESGTWGTVSARGTTMAEAFVKILDKMDWTDDPI